MMHEQLNSQSFCGKTTKKNNKVKKKGSPTVRDQQREGIRN